MRFFRKADNLEGGNKLNFVVHKTSSSGRRRRVVGVRVRGLVVFLVVLKLQYIRSPQRNPTPKLKNFGVNP